MRYPTGVFCLCTSLSSRLLAKRIGCLVLFDCSLYLVSFATILFFICFSLLLTSYSISSSFEVFLIHYIHSIWIDEATSVVEIVVSSHSYHLAPRYADPLVTCSKGGECIRNYRWLL